MGAFPVGTFSTSRGCCCCGGVGAAGAGYRGSGVSEALEDEKKGILRGLWGDVDAVV